MSPTFEPTLTTTDWNEEWKRLQAARGRADDVGAWDERAKTFPVKHGSQSGYVERFLQLAGIAPGETVLDMGCGTGSLATPLAQAGCTVVACDFSRGMLDAMRTDQDELGVRGVEARLMSWDDEWDSFGLSAKSADVAIASRSIATSDLRGSLMKLDRVARRRVCITLPCGPSPKLDERLAQVAGLRGRLGRDFLYAFNILASEGRNPEVAYIPSARMESFASFEEALEAYVGIASAAARGQADGIDAHSISEKIGAWLRENLVASESGLRLATPRQVTWAFIAWQPA